MSFESLLIDDIKRAVNDAMDIAIEAVQKELTEQGHVLTAALRDNIEKVTKLEGTAVISRMFLEDYFQVIETGVPASKIPYTPGGGGGGSSKYIEGLISSFLKRGRGFEEAKRAAFATANRQSSGGMPTRASFRFSRNGRRTKFLSTATKDAMPAMAKAMGRLASYFQDTLDRELRTFSNLRFTA